MGIAWLIYIYIEYFYIVFTINKPQLRKHAYSKILEINDKKKKKKKKKKKSSR